MLKWAKINKTPRNNPGQKHKTVADGTIFVRLTKNNTILTLTDVNKDILTWTSCTNCGFVGGQKKTPMATIMTSEEIGLRAKDFKMSKVDLIFTGIARRRKQVLRGLVRSKIRILRFTIQTSIPYNGCRLEKKAR